MALSRNQRRLPVDHQSRFSNLSAHYNDFLFATVWDEANGMRLSVLSALARIDVDPWEEATRLAAMPKAVAERALISILDLASSKSSDQHETKATAARLVRLLPQSGAAAISTAAGATRSPLQNYWWLWAGLALVMTVITPHHDATTTSPTMAQSEPNRPAPMTGVTAPLNTGGATEAVKNNNQAPAPAANLAPVPIAQSR